MPIHPIVLTYAIIYLAALALAFWRRKTFPLSESILVILIVGIGFTGLVYLVTLPVKAAAVSVNVPTSELVFTLGYIVLVAALLVVNKTPQSWKGNFLKEKAAAILFKLPVFVLIPIAALRLLWNVSWADLGFAWGDVPEQLFAAAILMIAFGGFNLVAGSGAAPLRKRQFSGQVVAVGFAITLVWNMLEVGLVEEFFFRGFLQTRLVHALGSPLAGICLASLLFGLAHAPGLYLRKGDRGGPLGEKPALVDAILYTIVVLSPTGWFTGLLYLRTGSLLAPILVHAAIDTVAHTTDFIEGLKIGNRTPTTAEPHK
jgi:membrane protease YdiL (CAAX protease family)